MRHTIIMIFVILLVISPSYAFIVNGNTMGNGVYQFGVDDGPSLHKILQEHKIERNKIVKSFDPYGDHWVQVVHKRRLTRQLKGEKYVGHDPLFDDAANRWAWFVDEDEWLIRDKDIHEIIIDADDKGYLQRVEDNQKGFHYAREISQRSFNQRTLFNE